MKESLSEAKPILIYQLLRRLGMQSKSCHSSRLHSMMITNGDGGTSINFATALRWRGEVGEGRGEAE